MRRSLSMGLVLTVLLAVPAGAAGAPPERGTDEVTFLDCPSLEASDGRQAYLFAEVSQQWGPFGYLTVWDSASDPFADPPAAVSGDAEVALNGAGSILTASIEMWEFAPASDPPFGNFLGYAELSASLTAIGDPEQFSNRFRDGNTQVRSSGTFQALEASGELVLPDGTAFDLTGCAGGYVSYSFFWTDPAAFVFHNRGLSLNCFWETEDGFIGLFASADRFGTFGDVFVSTDDGYIFGFDPASTLSRTAFSASFQLYDENDEPVGSASASADLTATGERLRFMDRWGRQMFKFFGERLSVDGTLELSLNGSVELVMDDESCSATDGRSMELSVRPAGPKPRPLANDTPEGAMALQIGRSDRVLTGANDPEPEEPCIAGIDPETGEEFHYPISYTAWWTFTGTGGEVTVSTSRSDFDTIVGVYQEVGGELVQVACVDDVFEPSFSLQAEATIETEAGATYYIQAGGYGGSTGRLVVSLR